MLPLWVTLGPPPPPSPGRQVWLVGILAAEGFVMFSREDAASVTSCTVSFAGPRVTAVGNTMSFFR